MTPYVDTPTIPEGMTAREWRYRHLTAVPVAHPWLRIGARLLAVAGYHAGLIDPYTRKD